MDAHAYTVMYMDIFDTLVFLSFFLVCVNTGECL